MTALARAFMGMLCAVVVTGMAVADPRIVTSPEPPVNYSENGALVGIVVDLVREIQKRLDDSTAIDLLPTARALAMVERGPKVMFFSAGRTPARVEHGYHFVGPVVTRRHSLLASQAHAHGISSLDDVRRGGLIVGSMLGDWRTSYLEDAGILVKTVKNQSLSLRMLMAGRVDLIVASDLELPMLAALNGVTPGDFTLAHAIREAPSFLMFSKDTPLEIVRRWEEALSALHDDPFVAETAEKWSGILGSAVRFTPERGFHIVR